MEEQDVMMHLFLITNDYIYIYIYCMYKKSM